MDSLPNKTNTPQTVRKLAKIPEKQEKGCFSLPVSAKNTKNSSFQAVSPTSNKLNTKPVRAITPPVG
jgi:hypothetical protein